MSDYTKEDEELYRPVYTAVESVLVDEFGIGTVGLSDDVTEAVLTVVIGWLAEHDRQVAAQALEQAAEKWDVVTDGQRAVAVETLMALAVEIREGRQ